MMSASLTSSSGKRFMIPASSTSSSGDRSSGRRARVPNECFSSALSLILRPTVWKISECMNMRQKRILPGIGRIGMAEQTAIRGMGTVVRCESCILSVPLYRAEIGFKALLEIPKFFEKLAVF